MHSSGHMGYKIMDKKILWYVVFKLTCHNSKKLNNEKFTCNKIYRYWERSSLHI